MFALRIKIRMSDRNQINAPDPHVLESAAFRVFDPEKKSSQRFLQSSNRGIPSDNLRAEGSKDIRDRGEESTYSEEYRTPKQRESSP